MSHDSEHVLMQAALQYNDMVVFIGKIRYARRNLKFRYHLIGREAEIKFDPDH